MTLLSASWIPYKCSNYKPSINVWFEKSYIVLHYTGSDAIVLQAYVFESFEISVSIICCGVKWHILVNKSWKEYLYFQLVTYANTRDAALDIMARALDSYVIRGRYWLEYQGIKIFTKPICYICKTKTMKAKIYFITTKLCVVNLHREDKCNIIKI